MGQAFKEKTSRVLVVEPAATVRQMLCDVVRDLGFSQTMSASSLRDALDILEVEPADWLITPLLSQGPVNALQVLRLVTENPKLKRLKISLIVEESELPVLPLAFQYGLLSWHQKTYSRESLRQNFEKLLLIL